MLWALITSILGALGDDVWRAPTTCPPLGMEADACEEREWVEQSTAGYRERCPVMLLLPGAGLMVLADSDWRPLRVIPFLARSATMTGS
jgi:hypothetical protein